MHTVSLFPMDLIMDLIILAILQLSFDRLRPLRLILAWMILTACTAACAPMPNAAFLQLPLSLLCAAVATGARRPGRILEGSFCMLCAYAAAAGFALLCGGNPLPGAIAGLIMLLYLLRRRRHARYRWNIELYLEKDGLSANIHALIDTGNRLREHRSGLPVLIVEASAMPQLARHALQMQPSDLRILPFGVLGGAGEISCFRADRVEFILPGLGRRPAPDCWIAVYHGRIPGPTRALAPPEFADAFL